MAESCWRRRGGKFCWSAGVVCDGAINDVPGCGFWDGFWALVRQGVTIRRAIRNVWQQSSLVIDARQCIREVRIRKSDWSRLPCEPDVTNGNAWIASNAWTRDARPLFFYRILRSQFHRSVAIRKKWPHFWGHISRGQIWQAMSGKAMEVTAPPGGAALREMLTRESEGHCFGFAAS